jgi:O-antigen/teichoic acid export membrane protein
MNYKKLFNRMILLYILTALTIPLGFLIRTYYGQKLDIINYGLFYSLFAFTGFFNFLRNLGLTNSCIFYAKKYYDRKEYGIVKALFLFNQIAQLSFSIIIGGMMILLKELIITYIFHSEPSMYAMFDLFIVYWIILTVYQSTLAFTFIFNKQTMGKIMEIILLAITLILSYFFFGYFPEEKVPVYAYLLSCIFISIFFTAWFFFSFKEITKAKAQITKNIIKKVKKYASQVFFTGLSLMLMSQIDLILVQIILGAKEVAYYSTGFAIASLVTLTTVPLFPIIQPLFMELFHKKKKEELTNIISFIYNHLIILILPIAIIAFAFTKQIIELLFSTEYLGSILIAQVLFFGIIIKIYNTLFDTIFLSIKKPEIITKVILFSGILNIILDYLFIKIFGIIGAAVATFIVYILIHILYVKDLQKNYRIKINIINVIKIILSSGIFFACVLILKKYVYHNIIPIPFLNFIIIGGLILTIAFSIYIYFLVMIKVIDKEKIETIKNLLGLKKNIGNSYKRKI